MRVRCGDERYWGIAGSECGVVWRLCGDGFGRDRLADGEIVFTPIIDRGEWPT